MQKFGFTIINSVKRTFTFMKMIIVIYMRNILRLPKKKALWTLTVKEQIFVFQHFLRINQEALFSL